MRIVNVLLVAAVAAVAVAAAVDALRDDPETALAVGAAGELVWSDSNCARYVARLPSLATRKLLTRGCGVFTRRDNLGIHGGEVAWFAYLGGTTLVLSREAIADAVGPDYRVRSVAWLGDLRYAAILSGRRQLLTLWQGDELLRIVRRLGAGFDEVRASPTGHRFAAIDPAGRLAVFDRDGRSLDLPRGRSIAWSPDGDWTAIAQERSVLLIGDGETARLPVHAVDLDWRRSP